jgi:hypothetical protein
MRNSVETPGLSRLNVVYHGGAEFPMHDKIVAAPPRAFV